MNKLPCYCWDTSAYLAWLRGESTIDARIAANVMIGIEAGEARLLIPTLILVEILACHNPAEVIHRFRNVSTHSSVEVIDLTMEIALEANRLRDACHRERPPRKLRTADAVILATAVKAGADMLHTTDPHLLRLDGSPHLPSALRITLPQPFPVSP